MEAGNIGEPSRRLAQMPVTDPANWSARRISAIVKAFPNMVSYLEIGLSEGLTFEQIRLPHRVGVDPRPRFDTEDLPEKVTVHHKSSDTYFDDLTPESYFDVVFLDGLHTYQQTYRDLINALRHCPWGVILIDDVVPCDEVSAMPDLDASMSERRRRNLGGAPWHGDVFRTILCLADHHPELAFTTIIDVDNPQTLVWKKRFDCLSRHVGDDILAQYLNYSYSEVFHDGVPATFNPLDENEALELTIKGVAALRTQRRALPKRIAHRIRSDIRGLIHRIDHNGAS